MSADWLPILASPKLNNKHVGKKGQIVFSEDSFDKLVASSSVTLQRWPRIVPDSTEFREALESAFPGFWLKAAGIGTELATRIVMAVGKAHETGAAVKIPAGEIFLYKAQQLGFTKKKNQVYSFEAERARQFVARRGCGSSASKILKNAIYDLGLHNHCSVAIFAEACGTHIVLVPSSSDIDLGRIYSLGCDGSFSIAMSTRKQEQNHVSEYMSTVPLERFVSKAEHSQVLSMIDANCTHKGYKAVLKEAVLTGMASDFRSSYSREAQSPRIFATGASMQFMPSWLRSALFPKWFELDFLNMHLSILNKQAELGLDLTTSIWKQILDSWQPAINAAHAAGGREEAVDAAGIRQLFSGQMNSGAWRSYYFDAEKLDVAQLKKALKTSLYSLQFGMNEAAARRAFTGDLLDMGLSRGEATFIGNLWSSDPLLRRISAGISEYCAKKSITPRELAIQCQEIETALVKEIYDVASSFSRKDVCITLHSHDGVSVWARKTNIGRRFYKKCAARCSRILRSLGIQTRLEIKGLDAKSKKERPVLQKWSLETKKIAIVAPPRVPNPAATGPP